MADKYAADGEQHTNGQPDNNKRIEEWLCHVLYCALWRT